MLTPVYEHGRQTCAPYWPMRRGDVLALPSDVSSFDSDDDTRPYTRNNKTGTSISTADSAPPTYRKVVCQEVLDNTQNNGDPDYYPHVYSKFTIETPGETPITVHHVHVDSWVDFSCPVDGVKIENLVVLTNHLLNRFDKSTCSGSAPLVAHCSAGVGRTGTYIALDYMLTRWSGLGLFQQLNFFPAKNTKHSLQSHDPSEPPSSTYNYEVYPFDTLDPHEFHPLLSPDSPAYDPIFVLVNMLRKQRVEMVQRIAQYSFVYENVVRLLMGQGTVNRGHTAQMMTTSKTI